MLLSRLLRLFVEAEVADDGDEEAIVTVAVSDCASVSTATAAGSVGSLLPDATLFFPFLDFLQSSKEPPLEVRTGAERPSSALTPWLPAFSDALASVLDDFVLPLRPSLSRDNQLPLFRRVVISSLL